MSGLPGHSTKVRGTVGFVAPELLKEEYDSDGTFIGGSFTQASDIFSVGCILYTVAATGRKTAFPNNNALHGCLTGETPLPQLEQTDNPSLEQLVDPDSDPTPLRTRLNHLLEKVLSKAPKERPDAAWLLAEFQKLQSIIGCQT